MSWRTVLLCAVVASAAGQVEAQRAPEYQVKAAYLHGLSRFVEWPAGRGGSTGPSFVVCVLGADPFGAWLDEAAAGAFIKSKPVVVRRLAHVEESALCQTLYISASERGRLDRILDALRSSPVLTVSDLPQFAEHGGIIGFSMDGSRVRFVANVESAKTAGLVLTSELLRVAKAVLRQHAPVE